MAYLDLNGYIIVEKGYFGQLRVNNHLVYYPLVSSQRIKVYKFETIDI